MELSGRRGSGLCLCELCAEASGCRRPPVSVATRNRALAAVGDKHWLSTQSEGWMASMARSEVAERPVLLHALATTEGEGSAASRHRRTRRSR
jgi:hypothetical protein